MARVFISHSSADGKLVSGLHRWLVEDGHEVFLDQDPRDGLVVGEEWQPRLHERLRWADAVACVLTSAYLRSVWCTAELVTAQNRGSRLLPIRAEVGVSHPLLKAVQHLNLVGDAVAARAKLVEALRRVDSAGGGAGWADGRSPFPGLRPFDTDLHRAFFGRTWEVEQLAAVLRSPGERAERAVVLVTGPSGCGKSSLVRAGLMPVMGGEPGWRVAPAILPGPEPVAALCRALAAGAHESGLGWTTAHVRRRVDDGGLAELANDLLLAGPGSRRTHLLLVVDQFEELLTQATPAERARFASLLRPALAGPLQVVGTLRPEFLDQFLANPDLAVLPTRLHPLRPLRREALPAVITGPARLAGIDVDEDLVARLIADTDSGEALPLLAYTLAQLADGVGRGGRLRANRYEELGGVKGALAFQADAALADAMRTTGRDRDQVVKELLRLVTVDEQGRPTRWRVRRDELPDPVATEVDAFVARRLMTTDLQDAQIVVMGVAHEAFLSAWPPLASAITAASTALRARRQIERAAAEWTTHEQAPGRLWERGQLAAALADTGAQLKAGKKSDPNARNEGSTRPTSLARPGRRSLGRRVVVTDRLELSHQARNFLLASIRRDRRRRGRSTAILSTLLVFALLAAGLAFNQQRAAEDRQQLATARLLLTQAESTVTSDPRTGLWLAEAAHRIYPNLETQAALTHVLASTRFSGVIESPSGPVQSVALATDGHILATASFDGPVLLWDVADPTQPRRVGNPLTGHTGVVTSVAFTPNGQTLATAGYDGTVLLWNIADPTHPRRLGDSLIGHIGLVSAVEFDPHGPILATASDDQTVLLWDVTNPAQPRRLSELLTGHTGVVSSVVFAPDGQTLATNGAGQTVLLWDVTDPTQPRRLGDPLTGHTNSVSAMEFDPHGRTLATASEDETVLLWDVADPTRPRRLGDPLTGHTGVVSSVAFTPNGQTLATAGYDGTVLLWDVTDSTQPRRLGNPLTGHTNSVSAAVFTPDGQTLATASYDQTVLFWSLHDPTQPRRLGDPLTGLADAVSSVVFAPDGQTLATAGDDGTVLLWDLTDPTQPRRLGDPLTGLADAVSSVVFAPDGQTLAIAGYNGTVLLWDLTDPTQPRQLGNPLFGHTNLVSSAAAFTPDGRTLAIADHDGTVLLWDLTDPTQPRSQSVPLTGLAGTPSAMAFAPDGRTLAAATYDGTVLLWDLTDPTQPRWLSNALAGHPGGPVTEVAFAADGHTLATAGDAQTVLLWDLTDPTQPRQLGNPLTGHAGLVSAIAFALDGQTLATAGVDRTALLWDLSDFNRLQTSPLEGACIITNRGLTVDEWVHFVPDMPYQESCPN